MKNKLTTHLIEVEPTIFAEISVDQTNGYNYKVLVDADKTVVGKVFQNGILMRKSRKGTTNKREQARRDILHAAAVKVTARSNYDTCVLE